MVRSPGGTLYWYLVLSLVAFGLLAIASIGLPFLVLGVTLGVLGPTRSARPRLFWPAVFGVVGFLTGFAALAPWSCHSSQASAIPPASTEITTVCTNAVGISYTGSADFTPPVWPAIGAGLLTAAGAGAVGARLARRAPIQP